MSDHAEFREISDQNVLTKTPLISVLLFAYKHERFISEAIESIVTQVCDFPFELIIGEDCSPDNTFSIAVEYQKKYTGLIRVLTGERNVGGHENVARSLVAARGTYVAFCDGDDYWHHQNKLQMQINAMQSNPSVTLCHSDFNRLIGRRLIRNCHRRSKTRYLAVGEAYGKLLHHLTVMTATAVYRTDIVRAFSTSEFANKNWPFGDYNLALFASLQGPIAYVDESTATWRKVRGSAMNRGVQAHLNARIATLECREAFMRRYPVDDHIRHNALCFASRNIMIAALHACRREEFLAARSRMIELGCTLPRLSDFLRCTAIKFLVLAKIYQFSRSVWLKMTTEQL